MSGRRELPVVLAGAALLALAAAAGATGAKSPVGPILKPKASYEARTEIRPSTIPNAGNGLYARVKIKKGEVIGELGGRLLAEPDPVNGSVYLAGLPDCALKRLRPYKYLDSKEHGGHVSRINFAPKEINGQPTNFQNSVIQRVCRPPWIVFAALRDIEPGEEIWSSYGPDYYYDSFMHTPEVRDFFCGRMKIDCSKTYEFEP